MAKKKRKLKIEEISAVSMTEFDDTESIKHKLYKPIEKEDTIDTEIINEIKEENTNNDNNINTNIIVENIQEHQISEIIISEQDDTVVDEEIISEEFFETTINEKNNTEDKIEYVPEPDIIEQEQVESSEIEDLKKELDIIDESPIEPITVIDPVIESVVEEPIIEEFILESESSTDINEIENVDERKIIECNETNPAFEIGESIIGESIISDTDINDTPSIQEIVETVPSETITIELQKETYKPKKKPSKKKVNNRKSKKKPTKVEPIIKQEIQEEIIEISESKSNDASEHIEQLNSPISEKAELNEPVLTGMALRYFELSQKPYELRYKGIKIFDSHIHRNKVVFTDLFAIVNNKKYPYQALRIINK